MLGELIPMHRDSPIELTKKNVLIGRHPNCDIQLSFSNVSGRHCRLEVDGGYWFVQDLDSRNGTRINGVRIKHERLAPGDVLGIADHRYEIQYDPQQLGAHGPPVVESDADDILNKSLLERAGIRRAKHRKS